MSNTGRTFYGGKIRKDPCVFCGSIEKMTTEHIHPKSHGGSNHWMNIAPACSKCNGAKSSYSLLGYMLLRSNRKLPKDDRMPHHHYARFDQDMSAFDLPEKWYAPLTELLCK